MKFINLMNNPLYRHLCLETELTSIFRRNLNIADNTGLQKKNFNLVPLILCYNLVN